LVTPFDDLKDVQVTLMKAPRIVMSDAFDFGKHTFAEAFEREWMQAPQNLPVGFLDRECHGADSFIVDAEGE
jgi:hypothetical protein